LRIFAKVVNASLSIVHAVFSKQHFPSITSFIPKTTVGEKYYYVPRELNPGLEKLA
jgi:hypothetical protein